MTKARDTNKLTPGEEKAVREYIANGGDQSKAFRKAFPQSENWKDKSVWERASKLFNSAKVQSRLLDVEKKAMRETEVTKEYVLRTIVETIERCKQAVPVLDKKGDPVYVETSDGEMAPAYTFNPIAVLKGAEMLAKHKGLYELDNTQKNPITKQLEKLSLETQSLIVEKLREVAEREAELDEESEASPNSRTTH